MLFVSAGAASGGEWSDRGDPGAENDLDHLGVGLILAMCLPLVARRLAPYPVLGLVTPATALLSGLDYGFPPVAFMLALYTVIRWCDPSRVRATSIWGSLAALAGPPLVRDGVTPEAGGAAVAWTIALVVGEQVRQRRERAEEREERARDAAHAAEREQRLASAEERTRIARDLHDSAGHAVNLILVQAGAARLLLEQDPVRSRQALETIEVVARETLGEIDQLVRALRESGAGDGVEPPAGLAALETLVERSRAAGLAVTLWVAGERRQLAPGVDQAAYRILREALTNAARHGAGSAGIELEYGSDALRLTVASAVGPDHRVVDGGGHGIVGMRERAALLGGTLDTSLEGSGFLVRASLPYRGAG